jgi:hypothetical protein
MIHNDLWRLIQDNDCHWYVIQVRDVDSFYEWVAAQEQCEECEWCFEDNRVNGPHCVMFESWAEPESNLE